MKYISLVFITCVLAACSSSGVQISQEQVSRFEKGVTTYDNVVQALGQPTQKTIDSDGNIEITYNYTEAKMRPESMIPLIGGFVGGTDVKVDSTTITFDSNKVMKDYKLSTYNSGTGYNLSSDAKY